MAFDYYYRSSDEESEVIIQAVDKYTFSLRVTEAGSESSMVCLSIEEIDRMIAGLQYLKKRM